MSGHQHWPAWATEPVDLVDADPAWTVQGEQERDHLETLLAPWLVAHIERDGSIACYWATKQPADADASRIAQGTCFYKDTDRRYFDPEVVPALAYSA